MTRLRAVGSILAALSLATSCSTVPPPREVDGRIMSELEKASERKPETRPWKKQLGPSASSAS